MKCNQWLLYDARQYETKYYSNAMIKIEEYAFKSHQYCVNHIEHITENNSVKFHQVLITCADEVDDCSGKYPAWKCLVELQIMPGLFTLSMVFLGFLLIFFWKNQRNKLFGWLMISAILMLFIFYLFLSIIKLAGNYSSLYHLFNLWNPLRNNNNKQLFSS